MILGGLVDGGGRAAGAVIAVLAVFAAVGAGGKNVVQEKFHRAVSSGSVGRGATAIGALRGPPNGNHGQISF
jgi:hypothetical protein